MSRVCSSGKKLSTGTEFMFQGEHSGKILIVFGRLCFGKNINIVLGGGVIMRSWLGMWIFNWEFASRIRKIRENIDRFEP
jgi:hypothetical protein